MYAQSEGDVVVVVGVSAEKESVREVKGGRGKAYRATGQMSAGWRLHDKVDWGRWHTECTSHGMRGGYRSVLAYERRIGSI